MKRKITIGSVAALLLILTTLGWHHGQVVAAQPHAVTAPTPAVRYVASKVRFPFHRSDCKWAHRISERNLEVFETREEAIAAGHRPCKECRP
jgi:hypothetical protein